MDDDEDKSDELAEIERQKLADIFKAETGEKWTPEIEREEFRAIAKPVMSDRDRIARKHFAELVGAGLFAPAPSNDTAGLPSRAAPKKRHKASRQARLTEAFVAMRTDGWDIDHGESSTLAIEALRRAGVHEIGKSIRTVARARADARKRRG